MTRPRAIRGDDVRRALAQEAARIMAEHGVDGIFDIVDGETEVVQSARAARRVGVLVGVDDRQADHAVGKPDPVFFALGDIETEHGLIKRRGLMYVIDRQHDVSEFANCGIAHATLLEFDLSGQLRSDNLLRSNTKNAGAAN